MDAREMLDELESNYLEVVLIPAPDARHSNHYVRAVQSANCYWYRKFCRSYLSSRKDQNAKGRTLIDRRATIAALKKIIAAEETALAKGVIGKVKMTAYVERLLAFMELEKKNREMQEIEHEYDPSIPF